MILRVTVSTEASRARAISAVFRPPTARKVSAIWDATGSDGWRRMKNNTMGVVAVGGAALVGRRRAGLRHGPLRDCVLAASAGLVCPK